MREKDPLTGKKENTTNKGSQRMFEMRLQRHAPGIGLLELGTGLKWATSLSGSLQNSS